MTNLGSDGCHKKTNTFNMRMNGKRSNNMYDIRKAKI